MELETAWMALSDSYWPSLMSRSLSPVVIHWICQGDVEREETAARYLQEVVHQLCIGQPTDDFGLTSPYPHSIRMT